MNNCLLKYGVEYIYCYSRPSTYFYVMFYDNDGDRCNHYVCSDLQKRDNNHYCRPIMPKWCYNTCDTASFWQWPMQPDIDIRVHALQTITPICDVIVR